jgi:glycerophosphoryl diester phosphodiesterase
MIRLPAFSRPYVLAHRMLAMGYPENTILSLRQAIHLNVDWVEFDVKVLADGNMISMHDATVDRTTDGTGNITKMNLPEVRKLNAGKGYSYGFVPVPTVEEILHVLATEGSKLCAEMHIHNLNEPEPLITLLDKYHVRDRCYLNLNDVMLAIYIREEINDKVTLLSLNIGSESPDLKDLSNRFNLVYFCIPYRVINANFVDHIHRFRSNNPVFVQCYPVQTEDLWNSMLNCGVDVIQTDFPEALMEYLSKNPNA